MVTSRTQTTEAPQCYSLVVTGVTPVWRAWDQSFSGAMRDSNALDWRSPRPMGANLLPEEGGATSCDNMTFPRVNKVSEGRKKEKKK